MASAVNGPAGQHPLPYPEDEAGFFCALSRVWPDAVWLDGQGPGARYSIMAAAPRERVVGSGRAALERLRAALARTPRQPSRAPFSGGAIGYFGYELGRELAGLPPRDTGLPSLQAGIHDWAVVLDHHRRLAWLAGDGLTPDLAERLSGLAVAAPGPASAGPVTVDMDARHYGEAFERVRHYLREGDCYQVNLARCLAAPFAGDPLCAYLALRRISAAPFAAYLGFAGATVLSVSPERFLSLTGRRVETRPIKGTRARCTDPRRDAAAGAALRQSPKDRAENLMIVDLLRNDLGQVCEIGSVDVPELFALESHPTVHHLVSTVRGHLRSDLDAIDLLAAALPGGSITGAPKRRAMEIIDELEPSSRGVYCGAVGYIGFDGAMDTSIAIRTALVREGRIEYRAGGGLVWDSGCGAEFDETEAKAAAFRRLLRMLG